MNKIQPVILAGGTGTRLWPVSREDLPKQFHKLGSSRSTYSQAVARVSDRHRFHPPIVLTNDAFRFIAREQAEEVGTKDIEILLEPMRRDSAAAVAVAACHAMKRSGNDPVLVLAADHLVTDKKGFVSAVLDGVEAAVAGNIVVFGIKPSSPHTGYGYIALGDVQIGEARSVKAFHEKPDQATAEAFMQAGYFWNSGNFLFTPETAFAEFEKHASGVLESCRKALDDSVLDLGFIRLCPEAFSQSPSLSFDKAVMESADAVAMVTGSFGWSDLGSWKAVSDTSSKDAANNVTHGKTFLAETTQSVIWSETQQAISVLGMQGVTVVATKDAVMVAPLSRSEDVKTLVEKMKAAGMPEAVRNKAETRPWGAFDTLVEGDRFKVKRITVKPGGILSLQQHHHRSEHWIVVKGTAAVTSGEERKLVYENQSVFLPIGTVHRLENPGRIPLEIIEVQTGSYLEEDDIIRIEDSYNRV